MHGYGCNESTVKKEIPLGALNWGLFQPDKSQESNFLFLLLQVAAHYLKAQYDIPQHVIPAYNQVGLWPRQRKMWILSRSLIQWKARIFAPSNRIWVNSFAAVGIALETTVGPARGVAIHRTRAGPNRQVITLNFFTYFCIIILANWSVLAWTIVLFSNDGDYTVEYGLLYWYM